jgi:hypothetical protein
MSIVTEAWIAWARLRRKVGKPPLDRWRPDREGWIRAHAAGRSFADVGALFNLNAHNAFLAEASGATAVTAFDAGDPTPEYLAEHERRGSAVRFVQGDLHDRAAVARVGRHDVVWCTGVLYHSPSPVDQLFRLREITGELLFLGTHTIAELPGVEQACVFYPGLPEAARRPYTRPHADASRYLAVGTPFDDTPMLGYGNFWWGITPSALRAMLMAARFEVVEERRSHGWPFYVDVVARPVGKDPVLPPVDYYRSRQEAREAGAPEPAYLDFYERRRSGS